MNPVASTASPKSRSRLRTILFRLVALFLGIAAGLLVCELFLRIFPPVQMRIRGGRIVLPVNQRIVISNPRLSKVDREIIQTRNSLGFRGPDPPSNLEQHLSIVTVGGSTTECYYLSDDKTWPERLHQRLLPDYPDLWLNNAGLDGHTTFGHLRLFEQYLVTLRPKYVLFLVGVNDVGLEQPREMDERLRRDFGTSSLVSVMYQWSLEHSATLALIDNLRRTARAKAAGVVHQDIQHEQLDWQNPRYMDVADSVREELLEQHRRQFLPGYHNRLLRLVDRSLAAESTPVLITQPALFGPAIDPTTGVDLGRIPVGQVNGAVQWQVLELYNDTTRTVARDRRIALIDLAAQLPKDSLLYYDDYHFTNAGAEEVANLIADRLRSVLKQPGSLHSEP